MMRISIVLSILCALCIPHHPAFATAPPPEKMPWTLREHYTFSGGVLRLDYAADNAEWRIKVYEEDSSDSRMHPDVILRDVGFSIELGDGRVITHEMLGYAGKPTFDRAPYTDDFLGEGTNYAVKFAPYEGLLVEHSFRTVRRWNALLTQIKITNQTDAPIGISKVSNAIIAPGNVAGLTENALISIRNLKFRGPYPVFAKDGPATSLRIHDTERDISLLMAFLPTGFAASGIRLLPGAAQQYGNFESDYAPARVLPPGGVLEVDPLFIAMGLAPSVMEAQYAYILFNECNPAVSEEIPRAWVTVPDTESLSVLRAEAANAKSSGIHHALIPGNWEGRPGSLEGGSPRFPRNMTEAARSLRDVGVSPGITVDPLLSHGGGGAWTAQSVDGQQWVNLSTQDGRRFVVSRMRKLIDMGFSFLVIETSRIPDDVLVQFGQTRAQADTYAFAAANEAALNSRTIVLPASSARLGVARDELLEASSAVVQLRKWNIGTAPITVLVDGRNALDAETQLAFRLWNGPIEFLGAPPRAMQAAVAGMLGRPALRLHPQDVSRNAPRVWLSAYASSLNSASGDGILAFTGAPGWEVSALENYSPASTDALLWQPVDDRIAVLTDGRIPPSGRLTSFGWVSPAAQPMLAGISDDHLLGLERVKRSLWDANNLTLSGEVESAPGGRATAHFVVPQHYVLSDARVNGRSVRPELEGRWVKLPLESGGGNFELVFSAR